MPGKRFQGHWKDVLADQRQGANRGAETAGTPTAADRRVKGEAETPAEPSPISSDYQAKLKAAALIGLSPRPQTTGTPEVPGGILAEVKPDEPTQRGDLDADRGESRFPRLRVAMRMFHRYRYVSLAVSLCALFLCLWGVYGRDDRPDRVPVSGRVFLDGQPLTHGTIIFVPERGRAATGSLDEQGRYVLTCFDGRDGAVPGKYRIEVAADGVPGEGEPAWPVPAQYAHGATSGLTAEITGPAQNVDFQLISEDPKVPRKAPGDPRHLRPDRAPSQG